MFLLGDYTRILSSRVRCLRCCVLCHLKKEDYINILTQSKFIKKFTYKYIQTYLLPY